MNEMRTGGPDPRSNACFNKGPGPPEWYCVEREDDGIPQRGRAVDRCYAVDSVGLYRTLEGCYTSVPIQMDSGRDSGLELILPTVFGASVFHVALNSACDWSRIFIIYPVFIPFFYSQTND